MTHLQSLAADAADRACGRRRFRPPAGLQRSLLRMVAAIALAAAPLLGFGLAQTIGEGTELLLTTPDSQRIVGHGIVSDGRLTMNLSSEVGEFVALLLQPDGGIEVFAGERAEGGLRLMVGDEPTFLERILDARGIELELTTVGSAFDDRIDPDDQRLEPPGVGD